MNHESSSVMCSVKKVSFPAKAVVFEWWCKVYGIRSYFLVIASARTIRLPERHKPKYI